jgi:BTB/POZ domain-containing protein 9
MLDTWVPEHSLRACEYISLNRVMSPSILPNDLLRLLRYSHYTDITIKVGEYSLQAHKSILVARSEYFRAMLLGGLSEASQKEIVIPDVDGAVFEAVLRYIYTGELDATQFEELVVDVIVAASLFRVEGLIRLLESIIAHNLDQSNVESLLQLATTHNFERLKASCNQMMDAQVTTFE